VDSSHQEPEEDTVVTAMVQPPVVRDCPQAPRSVSRDYADAKDLQEGLRALARRSAPYAGLLAERPGIRLAYFLRSGAVRTLTEHGRALLRSDLDLITRAATVPPGLDTNAFYDRILSRPVPVRTPPTLSGADR
jgi:hypothetical protein